MSKLIITKIDIQGKERIFRGFHDGSKFYQIGLESDDKENTAAVGNIYVGRVRDVVKNINAAFIEYQKGEVGYFSIPENKNPVFLNTKTNTKICQGDLLLVQVAKEAVKTKEPVLTSNISLTGKYIVLNVSKNGIGFSGKIKDTSFRNEIKAVLMEELARISEQDREDYGVIIRTNALNADAADIKREFLCLLNNYRSIRNEAVCRTCFTTMYKEDYNYLKIIKGAYSGEIEEIITDDETIYNNICSYLDINGLTGYREVLRLYNDNLLPLHKLYSVESLMRDVTDKKVWLKSGAYLVIEPTEAMVVIDVNTGKCVKGKDLRHTVLNVNLEAAKEIAYQLRLRNLSGIIIIDFINMEEEDDRQKLLSALNEYFIKDRIKTTLVDMTKLNLVEVTRKKTEPPIAEQIRNVFVQ